MLDYLAIGVHELANISERRIERLVNPGKNCKWNCFWEFKDNSRFDSVSLFMEFQELTSCH